MKKNIYINLAILFNLPLCYANFFIDNKKSDIINLSKSSDTKIVLICQSQSTYDRLVQKFGVQLQSPDAPFRLKFQTNEMNASTYYYMPMAIVDGGNIVFAGNAEQQAQMFREGFHNFVQDLSSDVLPDPESNPAYYIPKKLFDEAPVQRKIIFPKTYHSQ